MGVTVLLALYKDSMLSTELPRTIRILKESVCPLLLILGFCNGFLFSSRFIVYTVQKCRAVWRYTSHISNKQSEGTHCVPFLLGNNGLNVFMIHIHYHNDYDYNDVMWLKVMCWMEQTDLMNGCHPDVMVVSRISSQRSQFERTPLESVSYWLLPVCLSVGPRPIPGSTGIHCHATIYV